MKIKMTAKEYNTKKQLYSSEIQCVKFIELYGKSIIFFNDGSKELSNISGWDWLSLLPKEEFKLNYDIYDINEIETIIKDNELFNNINEPIIVIDNKFYIMKLTAIK